MTVFSGEQLHRPLFEEPTESIERPDEWSAPHGFMVGSWFNLSFQHLGQQYYDAANLLVESVRHQDIADYQISNPILYLYRHSIELFIKAVMGDAAKTHRLEVLAEEFQGFVKEEFNADVPDWIVNRIEELAEFDPNSTAFRYNQNYDKNRKIDIPLGGEYHVDLNHLQNAMRALNIALVGVIAAIACGEGKNNMGAIS